MRTNRKWYQMDFQFSFAVLITKINLSNAPYIDLYSFCIKLYNKNIFNKISKLVIFCYQKLKKFLWKCALIELQVRTNRGMVFKNKCALNESALIEVRTKRGITVIFLKTILILRCKSQKYFFSNHCAELFLGERSSAHISSI